MEHTDNVSITLSSLYAEPGQSVVTAGNKQLQWWKAEQVKHSRTSVLASVIYDQSLGLHCIIITDPL